jgi:hypothetical protein
MIIAHKNRFIFVKSRKTAGSSIQHALATFCEPEDVISGSGFSRNIDQIGDKNRAHVEAEEIRCLLGAEVWESYYKFCFIRNPWDLTISRFFWDIKKMRTQEVDFNRWLKSKKISQLEIDTLTPYTHIKGKLAVDFVGRYEHLSEDFARLCNKLELPLPELPHQKARHVAKQHYSQYYNDESIEIVRKLHGEAIDYFGYSFETA